MPIMEPSSRVTDKRRARQHNTKVQQRPLIDSDLMETTDRQHAKIQQLQLFKHAYDNNRQQ